MKKYLLNFALLCCVVLLTKTYSHAQAQEMPLAEVEYMKIKDGHFSEYLAGETAWKKIHLNRIAGKNITGWNLYRRVYPAGSNVAYEYMTATIYANAKALEEKNGSFDFEKIMKGMTAEQIYNATNIENVRSIVGGGLYQLRLNAGNKSGKYLQIREVALNSNARDEYLKLLTDLNPTLELAIKNGKALRRNIWENMVSNGPAFAAVYDYANLTDALKNASGLPNLTEEYEKLNPGKKWKEMSEKINSLYTITNHEIWELVLDTQQP